jgi:hypothetical protein
MGWIWIGVVPSGSGMGMVGFDVRFGLLLDGGKRMRRGKRWRRRREMEGEGGGRVWWGFGVRAV